MLAQCQEKLSADLRRRLLVAAQVEIGRVEELEKGKTAEN